jgi:hypothetical protein
MPTNDLVVLLTVERDRLNRAIEALQGSAAGFGDSRLGDGQKRPVSAATRRRMALAQKRRWAAARKSPSGSASTTTSSASKRRISKEGMQRIIAAAKKRWARYRAEQAKPKPANKTAARKASTKAA